MKLLRRTHTTAATAESIAPAPHPESCPWCGQSHVRGIVAATADPHYRCAACGTTFFIHMPTPRPLVQRRRTEETL